MTSIEKAMWKYLTITKPMVVIGASTMRELQAGVQHHRVCRDVYKHQLDRGAFFVHTMVEPYTGAGPLIAEHFWRNSKAQKIRKGQSLLVTNSTNIAKEYKKTIGRNDDGLLRTVLRGIRQELRAVGQLCGMDYGGPTVDEP